MRYKLVPACSGMFRVIVHERRFAEIVPPSHLHQPSAGSFVMWTYISKLLIAGNVGIMVFFMIAVAPTIFTVLPPQWSAAYVRKFFPKYFLFLGVSTAAAAALGVAAGMDRIRQSALLACALIFFFNCFWLTPRVNQARDNKQHSAFKTLHWLSVGLNMVQLLAFIWLLIPTGRAP